MKACLIKLITRVQTYNIVRRQLKRLRSHIKVRKAKTRDRLELSRWFGNRGMNEPGPVDYETEQVFVARFHGILAGCVKLIYFGAKRPNMPGYWLYALVVKSVFRGMGAGQMLCRTAVQYAQSCGVSDLHLLAHPENLIALRVYENSGFEKNFALLSTLSVDPSLYVYSYTINKRSY